MLETDHYQCPYCGEQAEAVLDLSGGDQTYICLFFTSPRPRSTPKSRSPCSP